MRAYFFTNFYISSIQHGIQSLHVTTEMYNKYCSLPAAAGSVFESCADDLKSWANDHKTVIILNGGMASDLRAMTDLFASNHNPYAWSYFCEEEAALEGSITSVGIILPEKIYNGAAYMRSNKMSFLSLVNAGGLLPIEDTATGDGFIEYTKFEGRLMEAMNKCGMAA